MGAVHKFKAASRVSVELREHIDAAYAGLTGEWSNSDLLNRLYELTEDVNFNSFKQQILAEVVSLEVRRRARPLKHSQLELLDESELDGLLIPLGEDDDGTALRVKYGDATLNHLLWKAHMQAKKAEESAAAARRMNDMIMRLLPVMGSDTTMTLRRALKTMGIQPSRDEMRPIPEERAR